MIIERPHPGEEWWARVLFTLGVTSHERFLVLLVLLTLIGVLLVAVAAHRLITHMRSRATRV